MLLKDYFSFLIQIFKAELNRVKRILVIIILGSFLMFFISFTTHIIKEKVSENYAGRYVLLPYRKNTQDIEHSLPFKLVDDKVKQELENTLVGTRFINQDTLQEITLYNLTQGESISVTYDMNPYHDRYLINETLLNLYQWSLDDIYTIDAIKIEITDIHAHDVDLYIPKTHPLKNKERLFDNFLTVQTSEDIEAVLDNLNQNITDPLFEYRVDDFSVNDLFLSLIASVEMVLLSFSFIIFIVSSSNIGTVMPYFIGEFKDEISLLRLLGLKKDIIFHIFMLCSCVILFVSLSISLLISYFISLVIALVLKVKVKTLFLRITFLFIFQMMSGALFSFQSIKKATNEVTYL